MTCHRGHREPERVKTCSRSQTRTGPYRAWHPFAPRATDPPSILPRGARKATASSAELRARARPLQPPLPPVAHAALCLWRLTARSSAIQTWQTAPSPPPPPTDVSGALVSDTRGPSISELCDLDKFSRASVKTGCCTTLAELWED